MAGPVVPPSSRDTWPIHSKKLYNAMSMSQLPNLVEDDLADTARRHEDKYAYYTPSQGA